MIRKFSKGLLEAFRNDLCSFIGIRIYISLFSYKNMMSFIN